MSQLKSALHASHTLVEIGLLPAEKRQQAYERFVAIAKQGPQFNAVDTLVRIALRGYTEQGKFPKDLYDMACTPNMRLAFVLNLYCERLAKEAPAKYAAISA